MKLLLLLISLFNQDAFLVKQGEVSVPLSDLDAYVYLLGEGNRSRFAEQNKQIEKNILTLLNVNIVYHHILNSDLKDEPIFKAVVADINQRQFDQEDVFFTELDLNASESLSGVKSYLIKTEYYRSMLKYLEENITEETLNQLAQEHYLINKKQYIQAEKRDISVVMLDKNTESITMNATKLAELVELDNEQFKIKAEKMSVDPTVELNSGHWGEFRLVDFNYSFAQKVFNATTGVIPEVLEDDSHAYIIRINDIQPSRQQTFDEIQEDLYKKIKSNTLVKRFQSIINTQASKQVEVNPELAAHVFERYKVFIEE